MLDIRKSLWALVIAIGMLIFSYWITNIPFAISGEKVVLMNFETVHSYFFPPQKIMDSVVLINVSYDKQLVNKFSSNGIDTFGQTAITDREKLLQLLTGLKRKHDYRYIMLDVDFCDFQTEVDSALYATILETPNIVIAYDKEKKLPDERLYKKAGFSNYWYTMTESDFVKYAYMVDSAKSIAAKMYEDLTGHHIERCGPLYYDKYRDNKSLVRSSIVLPMDYIPNKWSVIDSTGQWLLAWHNLGSEVLRYGVDELNTQNRYIIVGAFDKEEDVHNTYQGEMFGAILHFNVFRALMSGHHQMSVIVGLLLFISFFIFGYLILSQQKLSEVICMATFPKRGVIKFGAHIAIALCSWLGFSAYLSILCILTYVFLGEVYDVFITSTMFWLMSKIVQLKQYLTYGKTKNN